MTRRVVARTATKLFDDLATELAYGLQPSLDIVQSGAVQMHNVLAETESLEWELDLKELWFTKIRWSLLVRQYLDRQTVDDWVDQIDKKMGRKGRGVAVMRTNAVAKRKNKGASWREWGACILDISFRALPRPQITLHSRTTYVGGLAALDLTVAHCLAKMVGERLKIAPEEMSLVWFIQAAQFHGFKSLPWLLSDPARAQDILNMNEAKPREPGYRAAKSWVQSFLNDDENGVLYGDMPYGQTRRARKRFHTEVFGYDYGARFEGGSHPQPSQNVRFKTLPSLPASGLNLGVLKKGKAKPSEIVRALYVKENDR